MARTRFTPDEARSIGQQIGIDWETAPFDVEQFRMGIEVELEHGLHDPATNVTGDDSIVTGKIALAHLNSFRCASATFPRPAEIAPGVQHARAAPRDATGTAPPRARPRRTAPRTLPPRIGRA